jgi:hypothetical protein
MRALNQLELVAVNGAGAIAHHKPCLAGLLAAIGKTLVDVDVVAKPNGSTTVSVTNNLVSVLVSVVWGRK